jgi:sterol desaturase/sphingolipid hydroxylase (fatty acid hydroxylase superfamily)
MGSWATNKYFLDKMTLADLIRAYFTHYAIMIYLLLAVITGALGIAWTTEWWRTLIAALAVIPVYPLVWYLLHRFVLHGHFLYKRPGTARLWKRILFDHHRAPNDLGVLFGALYTTLPTLVLVILPIGWSIGGPAGIAAGLFMGLVTTCFCEFCHCIQHLPFQPRGQWLPQIKKLHIDHHFHSENGNFGFTNFFWDRVFGTFYPHPKLLPRSDRVVNLGYSSDHVIRYPWVARLSGANGSDGGGHRAWAG